MMKPLIIVVLLVISFPAY
ncbi:type I toxin-antitoxin system Ibs family toxin [Escherichia coli]|nr:type I toxin-antitoxin system Ibs family toxin [Escherichia coli]EHW4804348.1 type I toxin-antitoxin system Ibs family toxin [Escherichia coli]EJZ2308138.1 type I toxin-antitoxin system Ibs family toxin [Escherichia coli]WKB41608.1 type I toxin-antitoxin system Ibs family toxin [Escherichia coli]